MGMITGDYNIGLEMVNCYAKYFEHHEKKLNGHIDELARQNVEIKIISDVMNKLAHAKHDKNDPKKGKIDFNNDETMKRYIVHIHKNNPTIFDGFIKGFPEHLSHNDPEKTPSNLTGEQITVENFLTESLRDYDMSQIKFDILSAEQLDIIVPGLDGQEKMHHAEMNRILMLINEDYDSNSHMTESWRQGIKEYAEGIKSIISKTGR